MDYDCYGQYDSGMVYGQQGYVSYDGQASYGRQSAPSSRSKHSYSQNRFRNRQRPEVRQDLNSNVENMNRNANNSNNNLQSNQNSNETNVEECSETVSQENDQWFPPDEAKSNADSVKSADKYRNRGRFQGTDSRSKKFDSRQQMIDRQRRYDRSYNANKGSYASGASGDIDETVITKDGSTSESRYDSNTGARPKSFRDSQSSGSHRRDKLPEKEKKFGQDGDRYGNKAQTMSKSQGHGTKNLESKSNSSKESQKNDNPGADSQSHDVTSKSKESSDGRDNSGRRKKKEYQVYSSSSPREWQAKQVQSSNSRNAYDRYNYRGQDYNKRHKEIPSQSMERGGERTKLTMDIAGEGNASQDLEAPEDSEDTFNYSGGKVMKEGQKKSKSAGPQRGSRFKQKGKVDESQRGKLMS